MVTKMTAQTFTNQLFAGFSSIVFVSIFIYILYKYIEYSRTDESQEYKLFRSEYDIYKNRKRRLIERYKELQRRIRRLELKLAQYLLDSELEATPIDILINAWKIGEKTVSRLYFSGYRTLKDLDNINLRRYSMPEYIGDVRFSSIKIWIESDKKRRKERIINEIKRGSHSNTKIGQEIEDLKRELGCCWDKIEEVRNKLSHFKRDLRRYRNVSFVNFFLGRETKIPFDKVINPELKRAEDLLHEILKPYSIATVKDSPKEKVRKFYKDFLLIKKGHPYGFKGLITEDGIYPYYHFLIIHDKGISFSSENQVETIHFKEIEHCSKIGKKILLILEKKGKKTILFKKNAEIAYNYIKTFKK